VAAGRHLKRDRGRRGVKQQAVLCEVIDLRTDSCFTHSLMLRTTARFASVPSTSSSTVARRAERGASHAVASAPPRKPTKRRCSRPSRAPQLALLVRLARRGALGSPRRAGEPAETAGGRPAGGGRRAGHCHSAPAGRWVICGSAASRREARQGATRTGQDETLGRCEFFLAAPLAGPAWDAGSVTVHRLITSPDVWPKGSAPVPSA